MDEKKAKAINDAIKKKPATKAKPLSSVADELKPEAAELGQKKKPAKVKATTENSKDENEDAEPPRKKVRKVVIDENIDVGKMVESNSVSYHHRNVHV